MTTYHLDGILTTLDQHQQRATYGAVAALVGQSPRSLMQGRQREQRNSWIVSHKNGKPTGYDDAAVHPQLTANDTILKTREELEAWLRSRM